MNYKTKTLLKEHFTYAENNARVMLDRYINRIIDVHICEDKEMRDMFVELLDTGFQKGTVLIDKLDKSDGRILI